jgi:hypothetical protein
MMKRQERAKKNAAASAIFSIMGDDDENQNFQ